MSPLPDVPVTLTLEPLSIRNLEIKVAGTSLAATPGPYRLLVIVSDRPVATFPFTVASQEDLLRQLKVTGLALNAENKAGRRVPRPRVLAFNDHVAVAPAFQVEAGILAPNAGFRSSVVLFHDQTVLAQKDFEVVLDQAVQSFPFRRLELGSLRLPRTAVGQELSLAVYVAEECKATLTCRITSRGRLTRFDGSLTADASQLHFDEAEYQEILRRIQ